MLNNLGYVYFDVGNPLKARTYFENALSKSLEVAEHNAEGRALLGLGMVCRQFAETLEAQKYFEEALSVLRREGDRAVEGKILTDLGLLDQDMGRLEEALHHSIQALAIHREVGARGWEGITLHNLGTLYFQMKNYSVALACFLVAKDISEKRERPIYDMTQKWVDALHQEVGKKGFDALLAQVEPHASQIVEKALKEGL